MGMDDCTDARLSQLSGIDEDFADLKIGIRCDYREPRDFICWADWPGRALVVRPAIRSYEDIAVISKVISAQEMNGRGGYIGSLDNDINSDVYLYVDASTFYTLLN